MYKSRSSKRGGFVLGLILGLGLMLALPVFGAEGIGQVVAASGRVDVLHDGRLPAEPLPVGAVVKVGDFIRTKSDSSAEILFNDGNRVTIGPRSRVDISEYAIERDTRTLKLSRGKVEAAVAPASREGGVKPKRFEIHTPNAVAGVRGTEFKVFFESNTTGVLVRMVHEGDSVYAFNLLFPDQQVIIPAGSLTLIRDRGLPTSPRPAGPADFEMFGDLIEQLWDSGALVAAFGGSLPSVMTLPEQPSFTEIFPGIEVGTVDLISNPTPVQSGAYTMDVSMTVNFFAPVATSAPTYWGAGNVQGNWSFVSTGPLFDPTGTPLLIFGSGPNGGASADFTVTNWDPASGQWNAVLTSGSGSTGIGVPFIFSGTAGGDDAAAGLNGTFTGTAAGSAGDDPTRILVGF